MAEDSKAAKAETTTIVIETATEIVIAIATKTVETVDQITTVKVDNKVAKAEVDHDVVNLKRCH